MATLGQTHGNGSKKAVCVIAPTTGNILAPTTAEDGVPMYPETHQYTHDTGHGFTGRDPRESTLAVKTGGTDCTLIVHGYLELAEAWFDVAKVNGGGTVGSSYVERFLNLGHFDRVAVSLNNPSGVACEAYLITGCSGTGA